MKTYRVLIVEDEFPARELLMRFVIARKELQLGHVAGDGEEALEELASGNYDLVFLDINLPMLNGLQVLERLDQRPCVIFTTAYREYAADAFDLEAVDYLLKPFDEDRFSRSVDRALGYLDQDGGTGPSPLSGHGIFVSDGDEHVFLSYDQILYLSSHGKQTVVHTSRGDFRTPRLLKAMLEDVLPEDRFLRIHKQFVVHLTMIGRLEYFMNGSYVLHLRDESESLPVSRSYAKELKRRCGL